MKCVILYDKLVIVIFDTSNLYKYYLYYIIYIYFKVFKLIIMIQFKNVKFDIDTGEHVKFFEPEHYKTLFDIKLDELIENITSNEKGERNILLPTKHIPPSYSIIEQTGEYKDDNRELKDTFTDFVNDVILNDENSLFNFLYIITVLFQDAISVYKTKKGLKENDIFFILKGGNVLRFVAKNFLFDISGGTSDILLDYYGKFFKRSDADFSIIINPKLDNYENIFDDLSLLSYNLLKYIQSIFDINKTRFFEWYKYDNIQKKHLLNELYKEINDLDLSKNDTWTNRQITGLAFENTSTNTNLSYINPPDIAVRFKDRFDLNTDTLLWPIDNTNDEIYVSYNEALSFMKDRLIKFNLIRAKYGFSVHYYDKVKQQNDVISVGGELIDVSIGHRDDEFVAKFYNSVDKYISLFELSISNTRLFKFRSYSLVYLFKDLYRILFLDVEYPWRDRKYVKRLNRLFYVGYIDLFAQFPDNKKRLNYLNLLLKIILAIEKTLVYENTTRTTSSKVRDSIQSLKNKTDNSPVILDLFLDKTLDLLLYDKDSSSTIDKNTPYDSRETHAPYNVDKTSQSVKNQKQDLDLISKSYSKSYSKNTPSLKHIESTSSIDDISPDIINISDKSLFEHKMDYIEACKENMEILLLSFKNIDMYCYKYAFKEDFLYENVL
jgi:hypothetical protein